MNLFIKILNCLKYRASLLLPSKIVYTNIDNQLERMIASKGILEFFDFDYSLIKNRTLSFVSSMQIGPYSYKYSPSVELPSVYSSVYACLLKKLYGEISSLSSSQKKEWCNYFDSFQNEENGLFYDSNITNDLYEDTDWWGARHLVPHIIAAYSVLGFKPKNQFYWVREYYDIAFLKQWLDQTDWNSPIPDANDIDNKIMNIGVALQYQRDYWKDSEAKNAIDYMKSYLLSKQNPKTGLWGNYDVDKPEEKARMIQFSYHLLRLFFYDNVVIPHSKTIIDLIISSQNKYGGFGVNLNSSACEDIDAIDPLLYLSKQTDYRQDDIEKVINRALIFVLSNQNEDGGYVFKRDMPFIYGHKQMSSQKNESAMFPTWFRTMCIAYILNNKTPGLFNIPNCPGY